MHPGGAGSPSREEALAKVRTVAADHRAAFVRLGASFEIETDEVVVDWQDAWGAPLAMYLPIVPALLRAAVARLDELERSLDVSLAGLTATEWESRDGPEGWSLRMVVDHIANGYTLFTTRLEPWPLDPDAAQAGALEELLDRVATVGREPRTTEHFGWNVENRRVRWTARKVVRVVRALQDAWLVFAGGGLPPQMPPRHDDAEDDANQVDTKDIQMTRDLDAKLRRIAPELPRVREIATEYRYYRDRLASSPGDELERWRAMRSAFRQRLLSFDDRDLACLRIAPHGGCTSVRPQLGLALAHVTEHAAQIEQIRRAAETPARG